ncbi:hypothetical protein [Actinocrispum wychmicini]|uniref:Uncharacterized protein n=1 Tax=Actinocrispum wychmicini TaxID=1213861 RepID=A0A4R2ILX0_9PSEU|nr:hypothetical protein [Actinocrispum wychmicini]TCO45346.1 hypothetical protein EV192_121110 [Actinocrispum wychmicini]
MVRTTLRRLLCLLLVAILALTAAVQPALALPPIYAATHDGDDDDPADGLEPLDADPSLPADLLDQIAQLNQQLVDLAQQARTLQSQQQSLEQRSQSLSARKQAHEGRVASLKAKMDAHNARPHVFQLPRQAAEANAYDAEAAQLNAERDQLNAEAQAGEAEAAQLRNEANQLKSQAEAGKAAVERLQATAQQIRQRMAAVAQKRAQVRPPAAKRASGGDAARQSGPRTNSRETGGDRPSRKKEVDTLDQYAKDRGAKVDKRPVDVQVDPDAVAKLTAREAAALKLNYKFQGRVQKPDGTYKVLQVVPRGAEPTAPQKALETVLARGGKVTADGGKTTVTEVERVEGKPVTARDITRQSSSDVDRKIREAAESTDPDKNAEAAIARALRKCIIQFNDPLPSSGGTSPGEIDAGTERTIVEVYNGKQDLFDAKGSQADKYINDPAANPAGRRVVYYVPNLSGSENIETIKRFEQTYGVRVFTDAGKLRNFLRRTGERC